MQTLLGHLLASVFLPKHFSPETTSLIDDLQKYQKQLSSQKAGGEAKCVSDNRLYGSYFGWTIKNGTAQSLMHKDNSLGKVVLVAEFYVTTKLPNN